MVIEHAPLLLMIGIIVAGYTMWMGTGIVIKYMNIVEMKQELERLGGEKV